jgi:ribosomal protein L22
MSAEDEKDDVTPKDAPGASKPAAKKAAAKKPAAKASPAKAPESKKPAAKKAAAKKAAAKKEGAGAKEPVAEEKTASRSKGAAKPPRRRVVRARARYVRTSARKARMVCGHIRGKTVGEARAILAFTPREVARDWSKLLESAVANAETNHELLEDDLIVREAYADEGPTIKRFRPRAMGRATPIRKRTSHLTITLTPGVQTRTTKRKS